MSAADISLQIPKNLKCIIFDMDGVLYDSMKNHEKSWTACFKNIGIDFPAYDAYLYEGKPGHHTIQEVIKKHLNRDASADEAEAVYQDKVKYMSQLPTPVFCPGMDKLLPLLRNEGLAVWVVTGSKQPTLLNKLGADFGMNPAHIISAKDVINGKPHPEPYLKAVAGSGFKASQCLVVENAPLGVKASKAADIFTIAVNTGILKPEVLKNAGADIVLPGTEPLISIFENYLKI